MSGNFLSWFVRGITLLVTFLVLQLEDSMPGLSTTGLAVALIALGIPHGAADHLVFRSVRPSSTDRFPLAFTAYYLLLIVAYGSLWYLVPAAAFLLFIGVSVYHFGQSYEGGGTWDTVTWGAFVLLFPILLRFEQAGPIISQMIGNPLSLPAGVSLGACLLLFGLSIFVPGLRYGAGKISQRELSRRYLDVVLLTFLYLATDLLLGFAVYFLLWHSLPAGWSQWVYLKGKQLSHSPIAYLRQLLPLSVGAFVSVLLVYLYVVVFTGKTVDLGLLFMLVSLITLPHAFLVDHVYRPG